jgi:hypothetical protein
MREVLVKSTPAAETRPPRPAKSRRKAEAAAAEGEAATPARKKATRRRAAR